jgi:hypothetical protein
MACRLPAAVTPSEPEIEIALSVGSEVFIICSAEAEASSQSKQYGRERRRMPELVCLFQDYVSDVSPRGKIGILRRAEAGLSAILRSSTIPESTQEINRTTIGSQGVLPGACFELRRVLFAMHLSSPCQRSCGSRYGAERRLSGSSREVTYAPASL